MLRTLQGATRLHHFLRGSLPRGQLGRIPFSRPASLAPSAAPGEVPRAPGAMRQTRTTLRSASPRSRPSRPLADLELRDGAASLQALRSASAVAADEQRLARSFPRLPLSVGRRLHESALLALHATFPKKDTETQTELHLGTINQLNLPPPQEKNPYLGQYFTPEKMNSSHLLMIKKVAHGSRK